MLRRRRRGGAAVSARSRPGAPAAAAPRASAWTRSLSQSESELGFWRGGSAGVLVLAERLVEGGKREMAVGDALRRLCEEVGWSYAVFWKAIGAADPV